VTGPRSEVIQPSRGAGRSTASSAFNLRHTVVYTPIILSLFHCLSSWSFLHFFTACRHDHFFTISLPVVMIISSLFHCLSSWSFFTFFIVSRNFFFTFSLPVVMIISSLFHCLSSWLFLHFFIASRPDFSYFSCLLFCCEHLFTFSLPVAMTISWICISCTVTQEVTSRFLGYWLIMASVEIGSCRTYFRYSIEFCHSDVIWCQKLSFPTSGISTILSIVSLTSWRHLYRAHNLTKNDYVMEICALLRNDKIAFA
jgi:hypothetical protein